MHVFVSVELHAAHVRHYADILQHLAFTNTGLYTPHQCYLRFLRYSSLPSAYEVIQHVPLSFALPLLCFQCPCMHQCQPPSLLASDL